MLPWYWWLIIAANWLGWSVYQMVSGHVWFALVVDIIMVSVYVYLAYSAKKRQDRRKA